MKNLSADHPYEKLTKAELVWHVRRPHAVGTRVTYNALATSELERWSMEELEANHHEMHQGAPMVSEAYENSDPRRSSPQQATRFWSMTDETPFDKLSRLNVSLTHEGVTRAEAIQELGAAFLEHFPALKEQIDRLTNGWNNEADQLRKAIISLNRTEISKQKVEAEVKRLEAQKADPALNSLAEYAQETQGQRRRADEAEAEVARLKALLPAHDRRGEMIRYCQCGHAENAHRGSDSEAGQDCMALDCSCSDFYEMTAHDTSGEEAELYQDVREDTR